MQELHQTENSSKTQLQGKTTLRVHQLLSMEFTHGSIMMSRYPKEQKST